MVHSVSCIVFRQEFSEDASVLVVFEDEAEGGDGGKLIPVSALGSPLQILLHFEKLIILSVGLKH